MNRQLILLVSEVFNFADKENKQNFSANIFGHNQIWRFIADTRCCWLCSEFDEQKIAVLLQKVQSPLGGRKVLSKRR